MSMLHKMSRHWRWLSLIANIFLLAILAVFASTVDLEGRIFCFFRNSPEHGLIYKAIVSSQVVAQRGIGYQKAVFLGDSIMAGADLDHVLSGPYLNLGIGGDTLPGLLWRLPQYNRLDRAGAFVVHIGVNDLSRFSNEDILANYMRLMDAMPKDRPLLLHAILPINEGLYRRAYSTLLTGKKASNDRIVALNAQIKVLAEARPNTFFCSSNEVVCDATGNLRAELTPDGLHLNKQGNLLMADTLRSAMMQLPTPLPFPDH